MTSLDHVPDDLPIPEDDGAAGHLPGMSVPFVSLPSTGSEIVDLAALSGRTVVYCYPMTGRPDTALPNGWDEIPGARGCTPQSCSFRDHHAELEELGTRVFGLSTQSPDYQREAARRLELPFGLLSDEGLIFSEALRLPVFEVEGEVLTRRTTLIIENGKIEKVFYPVFPPQENAAEVVQWLSRNTTDTERT